MLSILIYIGKYKLLIFYVMFGYLNVKR